MPSRLIVHILLALLLIEIAAFAESDPAAELRRLQEQRQKALAVAVDPVNRRYQASLEQLMRRATLANDLDTAMKVKAEIEALSGTASSSTSITTSQPEATGRTLEALLPGSRWVWFSSPDMSGEPLWVEFYKFGQGHASWGAPLAFQIVSPTVLKVVQADGGMNTWFFAMDLAKKEGRPDPVKSEGHEKRSMRYEKKISSTPPR